MKNLNFKLILKNFLLVTLVSFLVAGVYLLYFVLVGIPKTQARNNYVIALKQIENKEYKAAESSLKTALSFWNEEYIQNKLDEVYKLNQN